MLSSVRKSCTNMTTSMSSSVRWAFDISSWRPSVEELCLAVSSVQPEEKVRIGRFHFQRDARASLAGRLMIRRLFTLHSGMMWNQMCVDRSEKGKPFVQGPVPTPMHFNVSHDGRYAVLAAEVQSDSVASVGCDVVWLRRHGESTAQSVNKFFHTMRRQFSAAEWRYIRRATQEADDHGQLERFHRCWALKESYVKADGIGVGLDLSRINFQCAPEDLPRPTCSSPSSASCHSTVELDGRLDSRFRLEECMLDMDHVVAVAICCSSTVDTGALTVDKSRDSPCFEILSSQQLLDSCVAISEPDPQFCCQILERPFCPKTTARS